MPSTLPVIPDKAVPAIWLNAKPIPVVTAYMLPYVFRNY